MSTTQGSTILCTPTSWSRTGQTPPRLHRKGEGVWRLPHPPASPLPPRPVPFPHCPCPCPFPPTPAPAPPRHLPLPHPCPAASAPSLRFAAALAQDLGHPVPNQWLVVADKIKVPFDPKLNFHPEFDGYQPGEWTRSSFKALLSSQRTLCPP